MRGLLARSLSVTAAAATVVALAAIPAAAATATIDAVSPQYGPVGAVVDITGSGLATASDVTFNGVDAGAPTFPDPAATDTHIQTVVPDGATAGALVVTTGDGSPSTTFTVQQPTIAAITISRPAIVFGEKAVVTGELTAGGQPVADQPARLQRATPRTGDWEDIRTAKSTGAGGRVRWRVSPVTAASYRVAFADVPAYLGSTTDRVKLAVVPRVPFWAPSVAPILTNSELHGRVRPAPVQRGDVKLRQRRADGTWHHVATAQTHRDGHFVFRLTLPETGRYAFRVRRPRDAGHRAADSAVARVQAVQRTLRSGMTGPDVTALQQRLQRLHYDVGAVTGTFGYDTAHAVVAFEKVQGLSRDGVVGTSVWKALEDPRRPQLRHPDDAATAGVEVDLAHQVIYYARNGKVERILDSSTGGGYYYTGSDGTQQQAITPTGHFSVVYKRDGWVTSPLGTLYRPAYFNYDGYAIHGEDQVPPYPASHGCVRITVPAMDRMNAKLYVGLSVWIY